MRVVVDANVFISYLLAPHQPRTITQVVDTCFKDEFTVVVPHELIQEIVENVEKSPYLQKNILQEDLDALLVIFNTSAEIPTPLEGEIAAYTQDPDDDYLIAYSLVHEVDYLVTGDPHLLVVGQIEGVKIVEPRRFLEVLREE